MGNLEYRNLARWKKYVDPIDDWFRRLPSVLLLRICAILVVAPVLVSAILICGMVCILDEIKDGLLRGEK